MNENTVFNWNYILDIKNYLGFNKNINYTNKVHV